MDDATPPDPSAARWVAIVLGVVVLLCASAEFTTRRVVLPSSRIARRVEGDLARARAIAPDSGRSVLVIGNSLLLYALDTAAFASGLEPSWVPQRFAVEQTYYEDWWFGLRSLWDAGARPSHVVLLLDAGQTVTSLTRGDYAAFLLVSSSDVLSLGREAGLHPTEISRLVLSRFSAYYGFRGESRKVLLSKIIPGMGDLVTHITPRDASRHDTLAIEQTAFKRLGRLNAAIALHGATFTFVLAPLRHITPEARAVMRGGHRAGVAVIPPPDSLPLAWYRDGYHLTEWGATLYTEALLRYLRPELARERTTLR